MIEKILYIILISLVALGLWMFFARFTPLLVTSGSMEPRIPKGSLILIEKTTSAKKGEVITFRVDSGSLITHRVIEIEKLGWDKLYYTKGDANDSPDGIALSSTDIVGKVVFTLPYIGYVLKFAVSPLFLLFLFYIPIGYTFGSLIKKFVNHKGT
ncbi:MAG TPA: signal peptidase I [candidate division WWE3 bacterium]|uniref:Signal peptidase I n=1 Tax=candidate division WWE3 bacterium TaxID=2053526 RepID=A0A7C1HMJ5_UNCKA|nr:signal peptidase I [candidate division WWE3 bacterium]